jgi:YbbR domain-containing protein
VQEVVEAITEPVSVDGARDTVSETVTVGFLNPFVRLKTARLAEIRVEIIPGPVERTLRDRPVRLRSLSENLQAQAIPYAVDVLLRGTRQSVNQVRADDVMTYVDLGGLGVGEYSLTVHAEVQASGDAGVVRVTPEIVQVHITRVTP